MRTVWLACTLSFILGLPSLGSTVAFAAATSIATIGLYISYGMLDRLSSQLALGSQAHRDTNRSQADIQGLVRSGAVPPAQLLLPGRCRSRSVDPVHFNRIHSATSERECLR